MPIDPTALRTHIYEHLISSGLPPTVDDIARHFGVPRSAASDGLKSLNVGKTVLLHPQTGEIWMAGPFSAERTAYRVTGRNTSWYANCAWDMLGVPVIVNEPVRVDAEYIDCGAPMSIAVDPVRGPDTEALVHILVPAADWYRDVGYT